MLLFYNFIYQQALWYVLCRFFVMCALCVTCLFGNLIAINGITATLRCAAFCFFAADKRNKQWNSTTRI